MNEIKKFITIQQLNNVLNIRNISISIVIHDLSLNSSIVIFRENNINQSESWRNSPFKLRSSEDPLIIRF
jgi:hypothetical protein